MTTPEEKFPSVERGLTASFKPNDVSIIYWVKLFPDWKRAWEHYMEDSEQQRDH